MLLRTSRLEKSHLRATDGRIGKIETFLFDEEQWVLRYILAKYGFAFLSRRVLISPMSVTGALRDSEAIAVGLTRKQIKNAPPADLAQPVSRKKEAQFLSYYRMPAYWGGAGLWGGALTPLEAGALFISPHWVREISWIERRISIDMALEQLRDVPKIGAGGEPSRDEEEHLHDFFGMARYWN